MPLIGSTSATLSIPGVVTSSNSSGTIPNPLILSQQHVALMPNPPNVADNNREVEPQRIIKTQVQQQQQSAQADTMKSSVNGYHESLIEALNEEIEKKTKKVKVKKKIKSKKFILASLIAIVAYSVISNRNLEIRARQLVEEWEVRWYYVATKLIKQKDTCGSFSYAVNAVDVYV